MKQFIERLILTVVLILGVMLLSVGINKDISGWNWWCFGGGFCTAFSYGWLWNKTKS